MGDGGGRGRGSGIGHRARRESQAPKWHQHPHPHPHPDRTEYPVRGWELPALVRLSRILTVLPARSTVLYLLYGEHTGTVPPYLPPYSLCRTVHVRYDTDGEVLKPFDWCFPILGACRNTSKYSVRSISSSRPTRYGTPYVWTRGIPDACSNTSIAPYLVPFPFRCLQCLDAFLYTLWSITIPSG